MLNLNKCTADNKQPDTLKLNRIVVSFVFYPFGTQILETSPRLLPLSVQTYIDCLHIMNKVFKEL